MATLLVGSAAFPEVPRSERRSVTLAHAAVLGVLDEVADATAQSSRALARLEAREEGLGGLADGLFKDAITRGARQVRWLDAARGEALRLAQLSSEADDPDMALALLRLAGPRLQAARSGALLLTAWLDFLMLADTVLRTCPFYNLESLLVDLDRAWALFEPSFTALSSLEPGRVEATATALPGVMDRLSREFTATRDGVRAASERTGRVVMAAQLVEMLTSATMMKGAMPRLPPPPPATLGLGLVMGSHGVMMGSQVVVTAEWVEAMRRLVQAGVLSAPAVGAAVRLHAGQVFMSQSHGELPRGIRDALGEGPEVRAMHETGRAGAGMADPPRHHVLPREHREWFEQRGFKGELDIDQFCVEMEQAHHQAIHGGGDWAKGRQWPGEWNRMIMEALREAEETAGRALTRGEVLRTVALQMKRYNLPMNFTPWRGR